MPAPRKITDQQRARVLAVVKDRMLLPTNKQLARREGISIRSVRMIAEQYRDSLLANEPVSRGTSAGTIACDVNGPDRLYIASRQDL